MSSFVFSASAQYLFKRAYSLTLGAPGSTSAIQYSTLSVDPSALRITFDIDKNMIGSSNKAKIQIYNMQAQTRGLITQGYIVALQAGYNNLVKTIFIGSVLNTKADRNGADIVLSLECGDGESAIVNARLDKSYPSGVTLAQILQDVGVALSTATGSQPQGIAAGVAIGIPEVIYNNGFTAHGACRDTLDTLLKPQGVEWNIQNGNLNIIPLPNYDGQTAQVLCSERGLIGVPSRANFFTQAMSLLNPNLVPGTLIQLISQNTKLNGFYKIRRSHFEGDTHDNAKWNNTMELVQMPNVQQNLTPAKGFDYTPAVVP